MARSISRAGEFRAVQLWLLGMAALVALTLLVGGATRLTGSGLSITEWRPVSGVLPPMSDEAWFAEFEKYKRIPQFTAVNSGMDLAEFKFIYWWEWGHRMLGRLIGVAFAIPFVIFLWRGVIGRELGWKLGGLFLLGGLQGAIGWWMVSSGLSERTDVSQYRLAIHLTLACIIFAALIAVADSLSRRPPEKSGRAPRLLAAGIFVLVLMQIFLGALVAKTGAGKTFTTWPLIDGRFIPPLEDLFVIKPVWHNFFENVLTVQFDHRMAAYLLFALAAYHAVALMRAPHSARAASRALLLAVLITLQAALGILTLLHVTPLPLALAHQFGAVIVLAVATIHATRIYGYAARP